MARTAALRDVGVEHEVYVMAHIEKRGPKRYRARYRAPNGVERSRTFERRVDAERWLDRLRGDLARGW